MMFRYSCCTLQCSMILLLSIMSPFTAGYADYQNDQQDAGLMYQDDNIAASDILAEIEANMQNDNEDARLEDAGLEDAGLEDAGLEDAGLEDAEYLSDNADMQNEADSHYQDEPLLQYLQQGNVEDYDQSSLQRAFMEEAEQQRIEEELNQRFALEQEYQRESEMLNQIEQEMVMAQKIASTTCPAGTKPSALKLSGSTGGMTSKQSDQPWCIAIAVDITGSMTVIINTIRAILRDFLTSENQIIKAGTKKQFCYILVGIHDYNPPDITIVNSKNHKDLSAMISAVNRLRINPDKNERGGPKYPEKSLFSMLKTLQLPNKLMRNGQLIVITDATSQDMNLEKPVTGLAKNLDVCINPFIRQPRGRKHPRVKGPFSPTNDGLYQRLAKATSGVFLRDFNDYNLGSYIAESSSKRCQDAFSGKNTLVPDSKSKLGRCKELKVSALAEVLKLAFQTRRKVIIRDPSGRVRSSRPILRGNLATFSIANPKPGTWKVCGRALVKITVASDISLDTKIGYLIDDGTSTSKVLQPTDACSSGQIIVQISSTNIGSVTLIMKYSNGSVYKRLPLATCGGVFITQNFRFPAGKFTYDIDGVDSKGVKFQYDLQKEVDLPGTPGSCKPPKNKPCTILCAAGYTCEWRKSCNDTIQQCVPEVKPPTSPKPCPIVCTAGYKCTLVSTPAGELQQCTPSPSPGTKPKPKPGKNVCPVVCSSGYQCKVVKTPAGKLQQCVPIPGTKPGTKPSGPSGPPGPKPPCPMVCLKGFTCTLIDTLAGVQQCLPAPTPPPKPEVPVKPQPSKCDLSCGKGLLCLWMTKDGKTMNKRCVPYPGPQPTCSACPKGQTCNLVSMCTL